MEDDIWFSLGAVPTPLHVAVQRHWIEQCFNNHGVIIRNLKEHPLGDFIHLYQNNPRHFRVGGSFTSIWAQSKGMDTVVISASWIPTRTDILVPIGSPLKRIEDLAGKRLTIPIREYLPLDYPYASAFYAWHTILRSHGISYTDVELIPVSTQRIQHAQQEGLPAFMSHEKERDVPPQGEEAAMLLAGKADAMLTQLGRGILYINKRNMRSIYSLIPEKNSREPFSMANSFPILTVVHKEFAEKHPDLIELWLKMEIMAAHWAKDNPQSFDIVLAGMTDVPATFQHQVYHPKFEANMFPMLENDIVTALDHIKTFLYRHSIIPRDFSTEKWVMPQYLKKTLDHMSSKSFVR